MLNRWNFLKTGFYEGIKVGRPGVFDRVRGVVGAAQRQASRSAEVLSGSDIRRFDEFTDATTRAVVGVHRDQGEFARAPC